MKWRREWRWTSRQSEIVTHPAEETRNGIRADGCRTLDSVAEDIGVRSQLHLAHLSPLNTFVPVEAKQHDTGLAQGDGALLVALGGLLLNPARNVEDRAGDAHRAGVEVDIPPLQGAELPSPGACKGGEHDQRGQDRVALFGQFDDGTNLPRGVVARSAVGGRSEGWPWWLH